MAGIQVEVWSDVVCPWCYIGKRRLEAALAELGGEVEVTWRSFELDPRAPQRLELPLTEVLARKYGMSVAQARQAQAHVTQTAAQDGLTFALEKAQTGNTFQAHRLIQRAKEVGRGDAMKERLMRAYFTEGQAISEEATLRALAAEVGLSEADVEAALHEARYGELVRRDEQEAQRLGIRGVPFFVIGGRYGVSGAQPAQALLQVLQQARGEAAAAAPSASGPVCDDDRCEV